MLVVKPFIPKVAGRLKNKKVATSQSLSLFKLLKMLNMNVKPATIPMKFELMALLNHIPPMGKDNGENVANGTYSEKRKQGRNTQISKGKFSLRVHFFIKISDK